MRALKVASWRRVWALCTLSGCFLVHNNLRGDLWCTGYYPGWEQATMPASSIDFAALTHIVHFSLVPNSDGTLNTSDNGLTSANSTDIVSHAHAAGK